MKKIVLAIMVSFGVVMAQSVQEVPLLSALKEATSQQQAGLYSYTENSLKGRTSGNRSYSSQFQIEDGELVQLDWLLHNRANERFLDSVQFSTVLDSESYATGYTVAFSWTIIQIACFDLPESAIQGLDAWAQGHLEDADRQRRGDTRQFAKRMGEFEFLLELSSLGEGQSRFTAEMSRDDSPHDASSRWDTYCVHEPS